MEERDALDAILVLVLAVATYGRTWGLRSPLAAIADVASVLTVLDIRVYLVLVALFGIIFVGYITVYLPKKDAARAPERR